MQKQLYYLYNIYKKKPVLFNLFMSSGLSYHNFLNQCFEEIVQLMQTALTLIRSCILLCLIWV